MATTRKKSAGARKRSARKATTARRSGTSKKPAGTSRKQGAARKASGARKQRAAATSNDRHISAALLPEFDQEMAATRRLLERVPTDKGTWKPHQKSFALGHLAQLVAWMPGWIANALQETALDLATAPRYSFERTERLLEMFDRNVKEARAAIQAASDRDYEVKWSLTHGDRVIMTLPRAAVVRTNISHLVHHRGQLTVYLRLVEVPIPSIYGPTADEGMPGF